MPLMRAAIYTRASLDRTGEGKSTDRQYEECKRLLEYKRWQEVAHKSDVSISAYGEKERPAWNETLAMIEAKEVDVVVAWHLDRLTRNMADLEKLILLCEGSGVLVATATGDIDLTNDTGRMVARILAAVARQEVERKAARQKLAHVQRREAGKPWAGVKMLGYSPDGSIIEHEAKAIREAAEDVIEKRASLAEIGRRWQELGLESPYKDRDKPWSSAGVRKVLANPRLAGFVTSTTKGPDGRRVMEVLGEGDWEPIVSESTLTLVTAVLSDKTRVRGKAKTGPKPANLLTGIMRCSKCGETVRAGTKRGVPSYMCPKWHTQVDRGDADKLVRSSFAAAISTSAPGAVVESEERVMGPDEVFDKIYTLRERSGTLALSYAKGHTSEQAFNAANDEIHQQIRELEEAMPEVQSQREWERLRADMVKNFLGQSMDEQRKVLDKKAIVTLNPGVRGKAGAKRQIEVQVKAKRGETDVLIPAFVPEGN
jgi:DNA invertase Pin-like site-specific DNA recombinase